VAFARLLRIGIALALIGILGAAVASGGLGVTRGPSRMPALLGALLPQVELKSPAGASIDLRGQTKGRPTLIFVTTTAQCASCSNLPLEFEIVKRELPTIEPLLVVSGSVASDVRPLLERLRLGPDVLIDERRTLIAALHVTSEPLTVLVDSAGRIVFVDWRSIAQAAQYPIGTVLHDLSGILGKH
jgi:peroxiredoxin